MAKKLSFILAVGILQALGSYASSEKGKHYNGVYTARENETSPEQAPGYPKKFFTLLKQS